MKVSDNGATSEPYSSTELYSGSWRQRPQRAFIHKTLTLATPSQPTRTAHTRAGCSTTGSRVGPACGSHRPSRGVYTYKCVQLQLHTGWFLGLVLLPIATGCPPCQTCSVCHQGQCGMPLFCITAFHTYRTSVKVAEPAGSQFCLVEG